MYKFLNAAEEVFGKHGYEGTTIRAIAAKAHVNLGTLKHDRNKRASAVHSRRLTPFKDHDLCCLALFSAACTNGMRPNVAEVLARCRTLVCCRNAQRCSTVRRIEVRKRFHCDCMLMDRSRVVIEELHTLFGDAVIRFLDLLRRACPELSEAELDWRVNCIVGA